MIINRSDNFITQKNSGLFILINFFIIFAIVSLIIYYIIQVNSLAGFGFKISSLKREFLKTDKENTILNKKIFEAASPDKIKENALSLGFQPVKNIKYVSESGGVAKK
ncbi:MAG: hypothetical protein HYV52_01865 [Parcubacteria group bacterium]|nr:hypothetical protein [Parcubacteria group bacterium]